MKMLNYKSRFTPFFLLTILLTLAPKGNFFWHMGWQSVLHIPEELIRGKELKTFFSSVLT